MSAKTEEEYHRYACSVVDCPNTCDADGGWCLKHLTPRSRQNGVRVTATFWVRGWGSSRYRETETFVVKSTAKMGKVLELAQNERKGTKLIFLETRADIECFDIADTRFRKLR